MELNLVEGFFLVDGFVWLCGAGRGSASLYGKFPRAMNFDHEYFM